MFGKSDIIAKFFLWRLARKTEMLLGMMFVAILRAISMLCLFNCFATPEVAIGTENILIPTLGNRVVFNDDGLAYPPEYYVPHLLVCMPRLYKPLLSNIVVLEWNWHESDHYETARCGHLADLRR
jgi:hypothetical protein